MTAFKFLSAGVIAAAMFATPSMAHDNHVTKRHVATEANSRTSHTSRYIDGRLAMPAPRVGALPAPPDGENCDVGDNPFIC
jgi:hypothetical protein